MINAIAFTNLLTVYAYLFQARFETTDQYIALSGIIAGYSRAGQLIMGEEPNHGHRFSKAGGFTFTTRYQQCA